MKPLVATPNVNDSVVFTVVVAERINNSEMNASATKVLEMSRSLENYAGIQQNFNKTQLLSIHHFKLIAATLKIRDQ